MEHHNLKHALDEHVQRVPRILEVYLDARRRYEKADRYHHNFLHVMRDLYRALVIAQDEGSETKFRKSGQAFT
ncbi:MAG: hypothetical protein KAV87_43535 [Desulfobacteraceae bacterium]|nr:hypothetical protein [Desulfobacteraceae bacterium]